MEGFPGNMASALSMFEIIEPGAAKGPITERKPAGLNHINGNAKTGAEAKQRTGIGRYVGLIKSQTHC